MRTGHVLALLLAGGLLASPFASRIPGRLPRKASQQPISQFRIRFGLTDKQRNIWSGRIRVEGGTLENVRGWRFSGQDRADDTGRFDFATKLGDLENQLDRTHPYGETDWNSPKAERVIPEGLLFRVGANRPTRVVVSTSNGSFDFHTDQVQYGRPRVALSGNAMIERMPVETRLSEQATADDFPAIALTPAGERWVTWLAYENGADRVMVSGGGKVQAITGRGDHQAPAIGADGSDIWVAWPENVSGTFHLFVRRYSDDQWQPAERLSTEGGSNLWPDVTSDGRRNVVVVWQGFRNRQPAVLARMWDGKRWSVERRFGQGNSWMPRAAFGGGKLWIVWDSYATGAYQAYAQEWKSNTAERVTEGSQYSASASVAVDSAGRPVVAWEESDALWGKDFAFPFDRSGTPLYKNRRVRVSYRDAKGWKQLPGPVADAVPADIRRYVQQPQLAMDGSGRLFLVFRSRTSAAAVHTDNSASNGEWETFLTYRGAGRWEPAIPMASSVGRNGMRAGLAVRSGKVHVVWATDNRAWQSGRYGDLDIYAAEFPSSMASGGKLRAGELVPSAAGGKRVYPNESADVQRVRSYRYSLNGKQYRILRGDLHRHTDLSRDGAGDGTLDEAYRYAIDAASLDFLLVSDQQMGMDEEYNWWLTQKSNDMYFAAEKFLPLYGYERGVPYPNGHRNVIWPERGEKVLKITPAEVQGEQNSGPILFPYLRDTSAISSPQSAATQHGTDWRDNDPVLEPVAEIYQGSGYSWEHAGAPRAQKSGDPPVHGDVQPLGYLWNAWGKGYRAGVEAGSGHASTHAAYTCAVAEEFTRQGIIEALKKRHVYAATDNIVLDFRIATPEGTYLMGDAFESKSLPRLFVRVLGTGRIARVQVIKNGKYIHKSEPNTKDLSVEFMDGEAQPGMNYYYIRVEQADGQLAWSSPIWIRN